MSLTHERIVEVLGDRERVSKSLARCHELARATVDAAILGRCEQRVAQLLGEPFTSEDQEPTAAQAACLAFTDQWVIDVASMTDQLVADVADHLGQDGLMDFVHGLLVVEQRLRLQVAWRGLGLGEGTQ